MHRQQLDSTREGLKELGTPISSFRIIGHQRCCAKRSYSVRTTSLP
jgi:hypothetical protein